MPNSRRGRGVDFEHRYKASKWAEDRLLDAFSNPPFIAVRLGISRFSPTNVVDTRAGEPKVPDLLVFRASDLSSDEIQRLKALKFDLREASEEGFARDLGFVLAKALCAIEVEFSPYKAAEMSGRHWEKRTEEAFDRRPLRTAKAPIAPNIFVKEEDVEPLFAWHQLTAVPIIVIHVFDQESFSISLDELQTFRSRIMNEPQNAIRLCHTVGIFRENQSFDRVDAQGARETKVVYKITPAASRKVGSVVGVKVKAELGTSSSKKYVSQVVFRDGRIQFESEFVAWIEALDRS